MTLLSIVIAAFHNDAKSRHTTAHQPCLVRFLVPLEESVPVLFFEDTVVNVKSFITRTDIEKVVFFHFTFTFRFSTGKYYIFVAISYACMLAFKSVIAA